MKALTITLAAAASTLMAAAASAAPLSAGASIVPESHIQQVRMVCNENGRCWREDRGRHVVIREEHRYGPRERHMERRDRDDRGGVGIRAPGVSVGIGTGRY
ncbi:hypothetical protein LQG66_14810 [Bradyrhizobium ontarionense]|uniref:PepSY domain-containing protein n=1 Tax=Bradyrhizobium ontarionense TaxID=2898149 RepID=A0ABY3RMQ8_9BRAD|nr:hypothetical protein [Bradyrhizobium sp. A19]UFZ08342.1 hypothetical protein LQG66_14810 [Bradyrhizobium sp. A19]